MYGSKLAALLIFAGTTTAYGQWFTRPATPHPSVVRIVAKESNAISYGSGTLVAIDRARGLILTNWHVVRDHVSIEVVFPDGFRSPARVLKTDVDWDLAALVIWKPKAQPVPIAAQPPRPGEPLSIAGYGSGSYRSVAGRCTQYVSPGEQLPYEMVELSAEARQGDSGGPIFNQQGQLAGVLFGAAWGTTSGSHSGRVHKFIQSIPVPDQPAPQIPPTYASKPAPRAPRVTTTQAVPPLAPGRSEPSNPSQSLASISSAATQPVPDSEIETQEPASTGFYQQRPDLSPSSAQSSETQVIELADLFGTTAFERGKSVLALFGFVALMSLALRRSG